MEKRITVGMVSLGCSKNQVDAERMLAMLQSDGYHISSESSACDVVIVNTCGFIEAAKQESIEAILEYGAEKTNGTLRLVVVTGCLAERYREELARELPEADVVIGIGSNHNISEHIAQALGGRRILSFGEKESLALEGARILANAPYYAYLKVAEGCDNRCGYCAIPLIRGSFRSRAMPSVLEEAETLAAEGVTELNIVAQDTTRYGEDLYGAPMLPELLRRLCNIDGLHWIRVLYCYPQRITDELLEIMATEEKIVKYMDVPVQHCNGRLLKAMNRQGDRERLTALCRRIRQKVPGIALRTTLITGLPGETEADFEELCEFVRTVRFDRLGCFAYSQEEDTPAAEMENQVEEDIRRRRADIVMQLQMDIAAQKGAAMAGKCLEVLCEGCEESSGRYYGRSYMDAPDIDTRVYFTARRPVPAGAYVSVDITGAADYDLIGVLAGDGGASR